MSDHNDPADPAKDVIKQQAVANGALIGATVGGVVSAAGTAAVTSAAASTAVAAAAAAPFTSTFAAFGFHAAVTNPATWAVLASNPIGQAVLVGVGGTLGAIAAYKIVKKIL